MIGTLFIILIALFGSNSALAARSGNPVTAPKSLIRTYSSLIDTHYRDFKRCSDAEQTRTKRSVRGILLMRYVVGTAGRVSEAAPIHNTTKSRVLADCVVRNLELITFPSPGLKPVTATHPFKFRPGAVPGKK